MLLTSSRGWNQSSRVCGVVWMPPVDCSTSIKKGWEYVVAFIPFLGDFCRVPIYLFVDDTLNIYLYLSNSYHPSDLFQIQISKASTWSRSLPV
jgi:hypothetical protein